MTRCNHVCSCMSSHHDEHDEHLTPQGHNSRGMSSRDDDYVARENDYAASQRVYEDQLLDAYRQTLNGFEDDILDLGLNL